MAEDNIDELLKKKYDFDKQNATEAEIITEQTTATNGDDVYAQSAENFWGDPEIDIPAPPKPETTATTTASDASEPIQPKVTDKTLRMSAETTAHMIKNATELIGELALTVKFNRKRKKIADSEAELDTIEDALEREVILEEIELEKKKIRLKRLFKKYSDKEQENKVTEDELERLTEAYYNYYKITQKTMSPETILYCEMINILTPRTMNVFFDW